MCLNDKFTRVIINNNGSIPLIKLKYNKIEDITIINNNEYQNLLKYKNKIEEVDNNKIWDRAKKISNCYEIIYLPNKKYKFNSISKYEPLSRSYFKMIEILNDFNLLRDTKNVNIACLAEGPGGFIEAIINYRKQFKNIKDNINAITLSSSNKDVPGWYKAQNFLNKNKNINISYGLDNTGNIYNIDNIINFSKLFDKEKATLVTADGGFDFSYNFNKQEQLSYRILFCEIVSAFSIQKIGGTFICKFFDMFTEITQSLIYLLSHFYKTIYITKPYTSRPANSEKYIVCIDFNGIDYNYLNKLFILVKSWDIINNKKMFITQLFENNFNDLFFTNISNINIEYYNIQLKVIKETLTIIDKLNTINETDIDNHNINLKKHVKLSYDWCKKYKVSVNYNSKYIQLLN